MNDNVQIVPPSRTRLTYEEEKRILDERWSKTSLFKEANITDDYKRACIAVILENQRLMNECATDDSVKENSKKLIPLAFNTWKDNLIWKLVSVQPMLGPVAMVYYLTSKEKDGEICDCIEDDSIIARTRRFNVTVAADFGVEDRGSVFAHEIESEVLKDLWNNAGSVSMVVLKHQTHSQKCNSLKDIIHELRKYVIARGTKIPNFLVVNPELKSKYSSAFTDLGENLAIYSHSGVSGVLLGYSGEGCDSSYVYAPYVPFTMSPFTEKSRYALLTRYGKKLLPNGSLVYGRLTVEDDEENL
jgi:hypothetical protein